MIHDHASNTLNTPSFARRRNLQVKIWGSHCEFHWKSEASQVMIITSKLKKLDCFCWTSATEVCAKSLSWSYSFAYLKCSLYLETLLLPFCHCGSETGNLVCINYLWWPILIDRVRCEFHLAGFSWLKRKLPCTFSVHHVIRSGSHWILMENSSR